MTKKDRKILEEIDKIINGLEEYEPTASGMVGTMQSSNNTGIIIGLEMAKKVILLNSK